MTTQISGTDGVDNIKAGTVQTDDLAPLAITGAKLSGGQTGNAPIFGARAWCVFNGTTTGTNAPTAGGNVTSVTRVSAGNYTITFTTAMSDTAFAPVCNCRLSGTVGIVAPAPDIVLTTTSISIQAFNSAGSLIDPTYVFVAIFR